MRRWLVVLAVLSLLSSLPGIAVAGRPDRFSDDTTYLFCDGLEATDGSTVFAYAEVSQTFGAFGDLAVWAPGAGGDPTVISMDATASLSGGGSSMTASYSLVTFDPSQDPPFGDPAGTATLSATLTPVGDPQAFDESFQDGNRIVRQAGTRQALEVTGELVLPGGATADLAGACFGEHLVITVFGTNPAQAPASLVYHRDELTLSCHWQSGDLFIDLFASADESGAFSDIFVGSEEAFGFGSSDALLTDAEYSAAFTIEGDFSGSAEAAAVLTPTGQRVHSRDVFGGETFKLVGEVLAVDGVLDLALDGTDPVSLAMDAESCTAVDGRSTDHLLDPRGPKGKPLANDTPDGAIALEIGQTDSVLTGGNAFDPEAACADDLGELPITYTAWWTFTGSGDDVTVSTAGSGFDTIVGVYVLDAGSLAQVGCVDDVVDPEFSLEAAITIGTDPGVTYYVQAGGYGGSTGKLVVSVY